MKRPRRHSLLVCLALLSLALQFAITFGHVHSLSEHATAGAHPPADTLPSHGVPEHDPDDEGDQCVACWWQRLAGTPLTAAQPWLTTCPSGGVQYLLSRNFESDIEITPSNYHARAPPAGLVI